MRGVQHRDGCSKPELQSRQDEHARYYWCPECRRAALIGNPPEAGDTP
jgi:hypothetical protein